MRYHMYTHLLDVRYHADEVPTDDLDGSSTVENGAPECGGVDRGTARAWCRHRAAITRWGPDQRTAVPSHAVTLWPFAVVASHQPGPWSSVRTRINWALPNGAKNSR